MSHNYPSKPRLFSNTRNWLVLGLIAGLVLVSSLESQSYFHPLKSLIKRISNSSQTGSILDLDSKDLELSVPVPEFSIEELIFDAVDGNSSTPQTLTLSNTGVDDLVISGASFSGANFTLSSSHSFPLTLVNGASEDFEITFTPQGGQIGALNDVLSLPSNAGTLSFNVYGLSIDFLEGSGEPTLADVVETLGYNINVGWNSLAIGTSTTLQGEEVFVQTFQKAGTGNVRLLPVGRYSPDESLPTGYYTYNNDTPVLNELYSLAATFGEHQALFPEIESGAENIDFDPGTEAFGIYVFSNSFGRTNYTEDDLNTDGVARRVRTYPLKDRAGNPVADSYLICFEDATNGDYQDYMYVLSNVEPAPLTSNADIRINAGGADFTDSEGNLWVADTYFTSSRSSSKSFDVPNTTDDDLYLSYRFNTSGGSPFSYNIPVPQTGSYTVTLHFLEPFFGAPGGGSGGTGRRVFNIDLENGNQSLNNLDLNAEVSPGNLYVRTFENVLVSDGILNIEFSRVVDNAIISGIEVSGPSTPALLFSAVSTASGVLEGSSVDLDGEFSTNNLSGSQSITLNAVDDNTSAVPTWLKINANLIDNLVATTESNISFTLDATGLAVGTYTATLTAEATGFESVSAVFTMVVEESRSFFNDPSPSDGAIDVAVSDFQISVGIVTPQGYELDKNTLNGNVNLYEVNGNTETLIPSNVNDTGGGDAVILTPSITLSPFTNYVFRIDGPESNLIGDVNQRIPFDVFESNFTTGSATANAPLSLPEVTFTKVTGATLGNGVADRFTSLEIGPDGKLYGSTVAGQIKRWDMNPDGTLTNLQVLSPALTASPNPVDGSVDANPRLIIGFTFDQNATAGNLIAYVTHNAAVLTDGPAWDGKITQLSGPNLETVKDVVVNLPRSLKDHLTNSIVRGPDGALYISQGSNTAGGAPDPAWGNRPERLLAGAILKLDLAKLPEVNWPLNAFTTSDISVINNAPAGSALMSDGTYNPYSSTSPLTIFSAGIRNAYDMVWHSNGYLYAPTNGTAGNNQTSPVTPASDDYITPANGNQVRRPDGTFYNYTDFPVVPGVVGGETQKDWLFKASQNSFHGHANPLQGYFVLNHGGLSYNGLPGQTLVHKDVAKYPDDVLPDVSYVEPAYDFGFNKSPNGAIEYKSNAFNGLLRNKLLVVRFSGQDDILILEPNASNGDIQNVYGGVTGFEGFDDPLDLVENVSNGNIYVAQYDRDGGGTEQLVLLRADNPAVDGPEIALGESLRISDPIDGDGGSPSVENILIENIGNQDLEITDIIFSGADALKFSLPNGQTTFTITPGNSIILPLAFLADGAEDLGSNFATLSITSNHLNNAAFISEVSLTGLGFQGLGGVNEPSLQAIIDAYNIPVNVGDDDPSTNVLHSTIQDGSLLGEEVDIQRFEKALNNPVEIELLSVFGPTSVDPIVELGWYTSGDINATQSLFTVSNNPAINGQTINPTSTGSLSFSPEFDESFGFYSRWPFFADRLVFSEDALNTFDGAIPHHVRVYEMKTEAGDVIPNQYIIAFEENTSGFDYQDLVFIVKNVRPFTPNSLPQIVFTPNRTDLVLEELSTQGLWAKLNVPNVATEDISITAIDANTGETPTWLEANNIAWGGIFNYSVNEPILPLNIDVSGLTYGEYQATIRAEADGYTRGEFTLNIQVVPTIEWTYQVSFQRVEDAVPTNYIPDVGLPFQTQNIGGVDYDFGWRDVNTGAPVSKEGSTRNRDLGIDLETETLIQMQSGGVADWAISIPNGTYVVKIMSGDSPFNDSEHIISAEGENIFSFPQTFTGQGGFYSSMAEVEVTDGELNIAAEGNNTKISYIWIGTPGTPEIKLVFNPPLLEAEALYASGLNNYEVDIAATAGSPNAELNVVSGGLWLSTVPNTAMGTVNLDVNVVDLPVGLHTGRIRATAPGYQDGFIDVELEVLPQAIIFSEENRVFNLASNANGSQTLSVSTAAGTPDDLVLTKKTEASWLTFPANPSLDTPFNVDVNTQGLASGFYTANIRASANGYADEELPVYLFVQANQSGNWAYKINFQMDLNIIPNGYIPDIGEGYGPRSYNGENYTFGWIDPADGSPKDNTASSRRRNSGSEEVRTLNHMSLNGERANWEMELPNGTYDVLLATGDPQFVNDYHKVNIEGSLFMDFNQGLLAESASLNVVKTIEVNDGKLSLDGQFNGINTKLQYIWIRPTDPLNDDIAPAISVSFSGLELSPSVYKNEVVVRALTTDEGGSGIASVEYSFNGGLDWLPYNNSLLVDEPGQYGLMLRATDNNGNTAQSSLYQFEVEAVPLNLTKLVLENRDKFPENDELTFHRIQNGWRNNGADAEFHDFVTLRVHNRGLNTLNIDDLIISNEEDWVIESIDGNTYSNLDLPLSITSNEFIDIGLRFIAVDPPNPRSNGIKVLHETLTIISNDDEMPTKVVKLHGLWQEDGEGGNEAMASEILEAFGLTIDIAFPSPNFKDGQDFSVAGDEIYTNNFVRADPASPIYIRQLAAFHGCCTSGDRIFTQNVNPDTNGGRIGNKGTQRTRHLGADSQTLLPRSDRTGPEGTLGDPTEAEVNFNGPFNLTINNDSTNPALNWPNTNTTFNDGDPSNDQRYAGIRIWKLRNSKGDIVPYAFVLANDVLFNGSNFDYNDNLFLITNVRPEFGTGYASILATGNGIANDPEEKQSDLDFGEVAIENSSSLTLNLRSLGQTFAEENDPDIEIAFVEIEGQNRGEFVADMPLDNDLQPGEATSMQVHFAPQEAGAKKAILLIHYNSEDSPMRIPLYGIASSTCNTLDLHMKIKTAMQATDTDDDEDTDDNIFTINGEVWESDIPYRVAGDDYKIDEFDTTSDVLFTDRDAFYRRYMSSDGNGRDIAYQIPLSNGEYTVRIHFAEIFWEDINQRVNDVIIEGEVREQGLDIFNEVGQKAALVKDYVVSVEDGVLDLVFDPIINRPAVAGIEIFRFVNSSPLLLSEVNNTNADCGLNNGSLEVAVSGNANPVLYRLGKFGQYQSSPVFNNLAAGEYTVYVKEDVASACESEEVFSISTNPSNIDFEFSLTPVGCEGSNSGAAQIINLSGGTAPYRVFWNGSTIQGTTTRLNLAAGDYTVRVVDANDCFVEQSFTIVGDPNCPTEIRINAGRLDQDYTDTNGNIYIRDTYFSAGNTSSGGAIEGTQDDFIYQRQRWFNQDFFYNVPVGNGEYLVRLHFTESYDQITAPGQRVFNVDIEGNRVLTDFDIFAAAGNQRDFAVTREFIVQVNDNDLEIGMIKGLIQNPSICAIEIVPNVTVTNQAPIVNQAIPDQSAFQDQAYSFQVSEFAFIDGDGDNLGFSATLANGDPLPSWLSFDPLTRTFSGTPGGSDVGQLDININVDDGTNPLVTQTFTLTIVGEVNLSVLQRSGALVAGAENKLIIGVRIDGVAGQAINSMTFNTNGTSSPANIVNARLYQTGLRRGLLNPQLIGTAISNPNGEFSFMGLNYNLLEGTNNFWLTYDIASDASLNEAFDAEFVSVDLQGENFQASVSSPVGQRVVKETSALPGRLLDLDGVDDYVSIADEEYFDFESEFSVEMWLKVNAFDQDNQAILTKGNTSWRLQRFGNSDQIQFVIDGVDNVESTSSVNDGDWHHVVAVYTGSNMELYIDGAKEGDKAVSGTPNTNDEAVWIGANAEVPGLNLNGQIDELRIWNVARTQVEIREKRHLTLMGNETGLLTYLQFNETTGANSEDFADGFVSTFNNMDVVSERAIATEPVGRGNLSRLNSQANSTVSFGNTGLSVSFGANHPNGEIVITQIKDMIPAGDDPAPNKNKTLDYWIINNYGNTSGLDNMTLSFDLPSQFVLDGDPSKYTLYKRNSNGVGPWTESYLASAVDTDNGIITFTGITGFSQAVIAGDGIGLPIRLLSFTGERVNENVVRLDWKTATEENNKGFEIQKSSDALEFETVDFVEGAGNSIELKTYQYLDQEAKESAYYRLKQVDFDGEFSYSPIIFIQGVEISAFNIYPNPISMDEQLNIEVSEKLEKANQVELQVWDNQGKLIFRKVGPMTELRKQLNQEISHFASGNYILKIQSQNEAYSHKLIKR